MWGDVGRCGEIGGRLLVERGEQLRGEQLRRRAGQLQRRHAQPPAARRVPVLDAHLHHHRARARRAALALVRGGVEQERAAALRPHAAAAPAEAARLARLRAVHAVAAVGGAAGVAAAAAAAEQLEAAAVLGDAQLEARAEAHGELSRVVDGEQPAQR